jgi:hypothetical protein
MQLLEQTLTVYLRGVFIALLILAVPFIIALFINQLTKENN